MPLKYVRNDNGLFVCPDCGITKANQNTMHYHMKKHQIEKQETSVAAHECKVCNKTFLQKQTLDLHIKSRHPELTTNNTKYVCPFPDCEFTALTKGNCRIHCLRVHFQEEIAKIMEKHTDTKMFECLECDKEFSNSCGFYYHCVDCLNLEKSSERYELLQTVI